MSAINEITKQYAERDAEALDVAGNYYTRHVCAMTAEGLHRKTDIAAELAWRDMQIDDLREKLAKKAELLRGCYAADHKRQKRVTELEQAVKDAIPAMRECARKNPKHHFHPEGVEQDPCGVHGWLAKHDTALKEDKTCRQMSR